MAWQDTLKAIAPTLGKALAMTGPGGMLAGAALNLVAAKLGVEPTEESVAAVVDAGLSPEQRAALATADLEYKKAALAAATRATEVEADVTKAYLLDADSARRAHAQNRWVMALAIGINFFSYACVFAVLYGAYMTMTGAKSSIDPGLAATVGTVVGAVVQWLMSNAAQANGYCFGSSPSSRNSAAEMAKAVSKMGSPPER